jgi:ketosteroid isomerase-like protein
LVVVSEENVQVFRRIVEAINRGDVESACRLTTEDGVLIPLRAGTEGAYRGHDGIRAFFEDNAQTFEVFRAAYPEVQDLGDRILAMGTIHIRGRGSGVETDVPTAGVATFRAGKITRWHDFGDRKLAHEAAGLPAD